MCNCMHPKCAICQDKKRSVPACEACKKLRLNGINQNCEECKEMRSILAADKVKREDMVEIDIAPNEATFCSNCGYEKDDHSSKGMKCPSSKPRIWAVTTYNEKGRWCRECGIILDSKDRYFACRNCSKKQEPDDGELIYNQH